LIVGRPGSGKSFLVKQLLDNPNYYYRKFTDIYIISPSAKKLQIKNVLEEHIRPSLDLPWLFQ
jgi:hypothetical protein